MKKDYLQEYKDGYTSFLVKEEASRCLLCLDAPCSKACPAGTDPAKFIRSVRFLNVKGAAETVRTNNILGSICARVCPTERYCQLGCSRSGIDKPIDIGRIQRYITDFESATKMKILEKKPDNGKKVAVIGSGPGGLSIAGLLAMDGYRVKVYEKDEKVGGYLRYGIPEYRLPTRVIDEEVKRIEDLGVEFITKCHVGKDVALSTIQLENDAVVLAVGMSKGKMLKMFENNPHVVTAVDLLKQIKDRRGDVKLPKHVLVIGGGDVAMDVTTSLKLLGVENVSDVVYEELKEFKASREEKETAQKNNVSIIDGYVPVSVENNIVTFKHRVINSTIQIQADLIVLAVGQEVESEGLNVEFEKGEVKEKSYRINGSNLFYVGDISHNEKTVVYAVRSAKEVAYAVKTYLGGK